MNQMITLCLGMVLLAFLIPSQVLSQSTLKYNATSTTLALHNVSSSSNSSSGTSPATTSTNTTTTRGLADSLYSSSVLFLNVASILVLNVWC